MATTVKEKPGKAIEIAERRVKVAELYKNGASYRAIARVLDVSHETVHKDVKAVLKQLANEAIDDVKEGRALRAEQTNMAMFAIQKRVNAGDYGAIDRWLKCIDTLSKLYGLYAPTTVQQQALDKEGKPANMPHIITPIADVNYRSLIANLAPEGPDPDAHT